MSSKPIQTTAEQSAPPPTVKRDDRWDNLHKSANVEERQRFIEELIYGAISADTLTMDSLIIMLQIFKDAPKEEAYDLASEMQDNIFRHTVEFQTASEFYLDYIREGVKDYHELRDEAYIWERNKYFLYIAGKYAQEPARRKAEAEQWEAERAEREKEKAVAPKQPPPIDERKVNLGSVALNISLLLTNPETPADLYNAIVDVIPTMDNQVGTIIKALEALTEGESAEVKNAEKA